MAGTAPDGAPEGADRRYLVISADSHDSPPYHLERYVDYMDPEPRKAYVEWLEGDGVQLAATTRFGGPKAYAQDVQWKSSSDDEYRRYWEDLMIGKMGIDEAWHKESFGRYRPTEPPGYLDPVARVASQETQGIVAEVVNSTGFANVNSSQFGANDPELLRAGTIAHLRWLADYSGAVPGRLATPVYIDGHDLDEAIADITWAREHGLFGGVVLPVSWSSGGASMMGSGSSMAPSVPLPPYLDRYWEPLWSVCSDLDLPLVLHVGQNVAPDIATAYGDDQNAHWVMAAFDQGFFSKRPFFQMVAGGVFDRHPDLKFCISEIHIASIPALFQEADHQTLGFHGFQRRGIQLAPSEYWYRNGFVAASMMSPREAAIRHDVGIRNLMFGSDYPHPEGTWPNTTAVIRYMLGGVPEDEMRAILGENAARCFGFDLDLLRPIADRVGPTVAELAEPLAAEDIPPYSSTFSLHPQFS